MSGRAGPRFTEPAPARVRRTNLTPMIDVLFILVVFFLLAARFAPEGALPVAAAGAGAAAWEGPPRLVTVTPAGVALNGRALAEEGLPAALAALMADPGDPVVLRPAEGADVQRLVDVVEALAAAGIARVLVAPE